jgi:hypothetical protein
MRAFIRLLIIAMASTGLLVVGSTASAASAGAMAPCEWHWVDRDPYSAQVVNRVSGYPGIALRDGPRSDCSVLTRVPWGHWVALDCFIADGQNVNGVTSWSHVRYSNGGPVYHGWISDYHLSDLGSHFRC